MTHEITTVFANPTDFPTAAKDSACLMAKCINHWVEVGNWKDVIASGIVSQPTLWKYHQRPDFNAMIAKCWPSIVAECEETIAGLMRNARDDIKYKAAAYLLEAHKSNVYDPGVRREKARASGNAATMAFAASLTPDKIKELQSESPFAKAHKEAQDLISKASEPATDEDD